MSRYTPAEHAHCHVCGHWTRLTKRRLMYRHRFNGLQSSDYCPGGRYKPGAVIPGYVGPYVRDPRPKPWWASDWTHGYRAHLPHPYSCAQGNSGCDVCGGPPDRMMHFETRDRPFERITEAEYEEEKAAQRPRIPLERPVFTSMTFQDRQERLSGNAPADSTPNRGESGNGFSYKPAPADHPDTIRAEAEVDPERFGNVLGRVPSGYRHHIQPSPIWGDQHIITKEEVTMNMNIQTNLGNKLAVRATVTSEDGTRGVFVEADTLDRAITEAVKLLPAIQPLASKPSESVLTRTVGVTRQGKKRAVALAIDQERYVIIDYTDAGGQHSRGRRVMPLRITEHDDGFYARTDEGVRQFKYARATRIEVE